MDHKMTTKESEKIDQYLDKTQKNNVEAKDYGVSFCSLFLLNGPEKPKEKSGRIGNHWDNQNHPDYSIAKID